MTGHLREVPVMKAEKEKKKTTLSGILKFAEVEEKEFTSLSHRFWRDKEGETLFWQMKKGEGEEEGRCVYEEGGE